ncbi:MAG: hypothetical protein HY810_00980 [Candidatus Omnitrophica bacterium]|nr:hypothetical protein [Candidatus Omnitrophota bacterium]
MNKDALAEDDILQEAVKWKQKRNPPLNKKEVALAIRNLGVLKWFTLKPSTDLPVDDDWVN